MTDDIGSWKDNVYGEITDEYRTDRMRAVIQPPQSPPVGGMDTAGVWTLAWNDLVVNEWAEAYPSRFLALARLVELIDAVGNDVTMNSHREFPIAVAGGRKAYELLWRNYIWGVQAYGYEAVVVEREVQGSMRWVVESANHFTNGSPNVVVRAWEPSDGHRRIQVTNRDGRDASFHEAAPLDETAASSVSALLDCFDAVAFEYRGLSNK